MTSPYLNYVRPPREMIEELILARELQLAKATGALQRFRVERDLSFLRTELARIGEEGFRQPAASAHRRRLAQS